MENIKDINEAAGFIIAVLTIFGTLVGALAWLLRLEFQVRQSKVDNQAIQTEFNGLETKMETKLETLQSSMNNVLITMGEIKGRMGSGNNAGWD